MLACDHTSVGLIVRRGHSVLLIERRLPPIGFAPPAGHVDNHGSFELAAIEELKEEVGLLSEAIKLIAEGRRDNSCRRAGGTWHYWKIFEVRVKGAVHPNKREVASFVWASPTDVDALAERTRDYLAGKIGEHEWSARPGLEPVWLSWLPLIGLGGNDGIL